MSYGSDFDSDWISTCNRRFNRTYARLQQLEHAEAVAELERIKAQLIGDAGADRWKSFIVERLFGERLLTHSLSSKSSLSETQDAFERCQELGFRDQVTETALTLMFARNCISRNRSKLARAALLELKSKLDHTAKCVKADLDSVSQLLEDM